MFGVYALAVLASLLTFGKLSDHVGRRPVPLAGLVLQAAAMVQFATAAGLWTLLGARIVQGVATGTLLGAAGAAMLDLDRRRGAIRAVPAVRCGSCRDTVVYRQDQTDAPRSRRPVAPAPPMRPGAWTSDPAKASRCALRRALDQVNRAHRGVCGRSEHGIAWCEVLKRVLCPRLRQAGGAGIILWRKRWLAGCAEPGCQCSVEVADLAVAGRGGPG